MNGHKLERAARSVDGDAVTGPGRNPGATGAPGARRLGLAGGGSGETARNAPQIASAGARRLAPHDPYNPCNVTMRALRTELLLRHDALEQANDMALLSPGSGEGRSQLSAALATSFAQLGRRTLLVDADLRRPQQHLLFGVENNSGLAGALARREAPVLQMVGGPNRMYLLTAGEPPSNPLELLSDRHFEQLVQQWRADFDYVVFDTPPLRACADGLAVATIVGRVLTLSRADHTAFRDVREMLRRLATTQAQVLGAVINHF